MIMEERRITRAYGKLLDEDAKNLSQEAKVDIPSRTISKRRRRGGNSELDRYTPCIFDFDGFGRPVNLGFWKDDVHLFGKEHVRLVDISKSPMKELTWADKFAQHVYFDGLTVPMTEPVPYPVMSNGEDEFVFKREPCMEQTAAPSMNQSGTRPRFSVGCPVAPNELIMDKPLTAENVTATCSVFSVEDPALQSTSVSMPGDDPSEYPRMSTGDDKSAIQYESDLEQIWAPADESVSYPRFSFGGFVGQAELFDLNYNGQI